MKGARLQHRYDHAETNCEKDKELAAQETIRTISTPK
jgi:hypothetical protein